ATNGDDFAELTGTVTIAAGQASATIDVLAVSDGLVEATETLSLTLSGDAGYNLGTESATMQISDGGPTVSIVKTRDASEAEAGSTRRGQFTVTRTGGSLSQALVVTYTVNADSTATSGADYTALSGTVTIPAGRSSATIYVQTIADGLVEPDETLTVDLSSADAYLVGSETGSATMTIDDNSPTVSIVKTRDTSEADALAGRKGQFTVTRTGGNLSGPLVVNYAVDVGSTAASGADFVALPGTVTIPAGKSRSRPAGAARRSTCRRSTTGWSSRARRSRWPCRATRDTTRPTGGARRR
ncbi:MAG: hypothetical protein NTV86_16740, partial [Planctomycetota bacterium]|nr:hypothetical protein [Planctomycetota bacterium]